jgi:uncharacterized protein YjbI with pentapeptide repeats
MMGVVVLGWIVGGVIVLVVLGIVAWIALPARLSKKELSGVTDPKDRHDIKTANRDLVLKALGGLGLIGTLAFTAVAADSGNRSLDVAQGTLNATLKGQLIDRYTKAVEQLGSDNPTVRIGGIYSLKGLLGDKDFHQPVVDLLASFVRTNAKPPPGGTSMPMMSAGAFDPNRVPCEGQLAPTQPPADVSAAMVTLAKRDSSSESGPLDLRGAYLVGLELPAEGNFRGALLDRANLTFAHLKGAHFELASLDGVDLSFACLDEAQMGGAKTDYANFEHSNLIAADMQTSLFCAKMQGASLRDANFRGTFLRSTQLRGAFLQGAHFEGGGLDRVDVAEAGFGETHLEGASLRFVNSMTDQQIQSAHVDARTVRPIRVEPWPTSCDKR